MGIWELEFLIFFLFFLKTKMDGHMEIWIKEWRTGFFCFCFNSPPLPYINSSKDASKE